ncbi:phosphatase PAP2 family protein [Phenylobacterium sp.]|uniref:phosphatase PAP2 family protein n=1 Tax=Phenylobacterium sp. TaxID=1871053 RepID=UPI0027326F15|nr:phosphatase PAP2 family protein [Phenylobacterium sp.]MDP3593756.1 phosphatase PAP2 family protein [Phenylobacterium sp.]
MIIERLKALRGKVETRTLVLLVALVGVPSLFLSIADEVAEGETAALDRRLLLAFRSPGDPSDPLGPRWFEESMRDITALGGFTVVTLLTIVATLLLVFHQRRREALIFAGTVILAYASSEVLKAFYDRDRPMIVAHGSIVYSQSFPSGHSTAAAATFLTLATVLASVESNRRTKALIYALAITAMIAVGVSRVYLGVHWPTDVLAGWALGATWALAAWIVLVISQPKRA